ncbi:MAG: hypothetical protein E7656_10180 [Ruminococcaceae bacterium]|nr:hypothetical protein [Oscillospiraceae bacterium]
MSSDNKNVFTKENLDTYLKELAKEFRKINGKSMPAEIILIGGAAILVNYGFRDMTTDVDAIIHAASSMKDAINRVGDKYELPNGWLNTDFVRTGSYSPKLNEVSVHYKTFSNVLEIRTISSEYLIAMKLRSGRKYKNDLSDIIGILAEHEKKGEPISLDAINVAVNNLYGGWDKFPDDSKKFIEDAIKTGNFEEVYASTNAEEKRSKEILIDFEQDYPGVTNESNINDILKNLKERQ